MQTSTGAVTLAGIVTALTLATGPDANATCPGQGVLVDNVNLHLTACKIPGGGDGFYGTDGVCLGSIAEAVACAQAHFAGGANSSDRYTLTVGLGTPADGALVDDLSGDPSAPVGAAAAFDVSGIRPGQYDPMGTISSCATGSGCLVITGDSTSAYTTITLPAGFKAFAGNGVEHISVEHMTIKQPSQTTLQGTYFSSTSTMVLGNGGSKSLALLTLDVINQPTYPIDDPKSFAAVANGGSGYPCTQIQGSCNGSATLTLSTNGICSKSPIVSAEVYNPSNTASTGSITEINAILSGATCNNYPVLSSAVTSSVSGGSGHGATFYVSYLPSPMTQYIHAYNVSLDGKPEGIHLKAYENVPSPIRLPSLSLSNLNQDAWGTPDIAGSTFWVPPVVDPTDSNRWTLTMNSSLKNDQAIPTYFNATSNGTLNLVCMYAESGDIALFNDLGESAGNGSDLTLNDMTWINAARVTFRGVDGVSVINNSIVRDSAVNGQLPCFSGQNGGLQFGQPTDPAVWGLTVSAFYADTTVDDSIAVFNDNGSHSRLFPASSIQGSSIQDADGRSINLFNNSGITGLSNPQPPVFNTCGLAIYTGGSPVYVDTQTQNGLTNCDPCKFACPITYTNNY